jgi:hypothetical protein
MDEQTKEQRIATNLVEAWYSALTEMAKASLSEHDLAGLETLISQVLEGDEDLISALEVRMTEGEGGTHGR